MNDEILRRAFSGGGATSHPGEDALVAFYRGGLSETEEDAIREHLAACAACVGLARDARAFVEAMGEPATRRSASWPSRWLAVAAALAAAVIAAIWVVRSRPATPATELSTRTSPVAASNRWKDLRVAAPLFPAAPEDELVFRSNESGDADFTAAMAPYLRGDYSAAEAALDRFLASYPGNVSALFYRGVSLLLLGRSDAAIAPLASAAASPEAPEGARWYLGLARLKSGDASGAVSALDAVASAPGAHREEARRLAEEVRRARDDRGR